MVYVTNLMREMTCTLRIPGEIHSLVQQIVVVATVLWFSCMWSGFARISQLHLKAAARFQALATSTGPALSRKPRGGGGGGGGLSKHPLSAAV